MENLTLTENKKTEIYLTAIDNTRYWRDDIKKYVNAICTVYLVDQSVMYNLCEITPSYELHPLYYLIEFKDDDSEGIDLFQDYDLMPSEVKKIVDKYQSDPGYSCYKKLSSMLKELNAIGYTFEYGLDGEPYDLRPINTRGKVSQDDWKEVFEYEINSEFANEEPIYVHSYEPILKLPSFNKEYTTMEERQEIIDQAIDYCKSNYQI